ncbi:MAG: lipocalin-like domain-containing protein [Gemmatimonadetes bacterium]|nr:lipocalin-like domain-containing protein [Gemmatimonadota bacterium]
MRRLILAATMMLLGVTALIGARSQPQSAGQTEINRRFIGTWRLVSIESGTPNPSRGPRPIGYIYYDATGHMAVQIMPDRARPSWSGSPTPEQARDAITGYTAYFGTYTVDERAQTVTHHREGSLTPGEVDFVRKFEFAPGDRLILMPVNSTSRLTWERIR